MAPKRAESDTDAGRRERCHAFAKLEELPVGSGIWLRFWKPEFGEIGGPGVGRGLPEAVGSVDAEQYGRLEPFLITQEFLGSIRRSVAAPVASVARSRSPIADSSTCGARCM